jgi:hypothetical protein
VALVAVTSLFLTANAAVASVPRHHHPIVGPCNGNGGSATDIFTFPGFPNAFPGADFIGMNYQVSGSAVVFDDRGAFVHINAALTFRVVNSEQGVDLWSATRQLRITGFAPEAPLPDVNTAIFPRTITVDMVPVGFSGPTVRVVWPVLVSAHWTSDSIAACVAGFDPPTLA